jgi:UDP-glucuronate 4-epimerase
VCHLAARAGVRASLENPLLYTDVNIRGTQNMLESAKEHGVRDFIFASSSSVYGNTKEIPFTEEQRIDEPISPYAATKKATELLAYTYHHQYGMHCTALRYFTVYGPWGRPDMSLYLFTKAILEEKPIDVYNHGKMKRDFTFIDDIVRGTIAALDRHYPYEVFNLGNSSTVELLRFIELIEHAVGIRAQKRLLPMMPGDVPETYADITKARRLLGFAPSTTVDVGIPKFVAWYRAYRKGE